MRKSSTLGITCKKLKRYGGLTIFDDLRFRQNKMAESVESIISVEGVAGKVRRKYNPDDLSPFPYENIVKEEKDLVSVFFSGNLPEEVSGVTAYNKTKAEGRGGEFIILINKYKSVNRRNFTIAHELGHYFLHKDALKKGDGLIVDHESNMESRSLFRLDDSETSKLETEANNFAAHLIMPEGLVIKAWDKLGDIQEMAKLFRVSTVAMSIRLERLGRVKA